MHKQLTVTRGYDQCTICNPWGLWITPPFIIFEKKLWLRIFSFSTQNKVVFKHTRKRISTVHKNVEEIIVEAFRYYIIALFV